MLMAACVASFNRTGRSSFICRSRRSDSSAVLRSRISTGTRNATSTTAATATTPTAIRSEEHTSELQSRLHLVCRLLLEKKKKKKTKSPDIQNKTQWMHV